MRKKKNGEKKKHLPDGVSILLNEDTVLLGDGVSEVRDQGEVDLTQSSLLTGGVDPGKVNKLRVNRGSKDLNSSLLKLSSLGAELNDLSGAHEGEV